MTVSHEALLTQLEEFSAEARTCAESLMAENKELRSFVTEKEQLLRSMGELHAQCLELHDSEAELHNELARVYVSASQLSSSISRSTVVTALQEIVANLIGSEEIAILSSEPENVESHEPRVLSQWGIESDWISKRGQEWTHVEEVLRTGSSFYAYDPDTPDSCESAPLTLNACVALRAGQKVAGAVAIFQLLPQKQSITKADQELCEMIGTIGGQALYCSDLHARLILEED